MSSSKGNPSNKVGWYKSMMAKLSYGDKLLDEASRLAENPKYTMRVKLSQKTEKMQQFAEMLKDAEVTLSSKKNKDRKNHRRQAKKMLDNEPGT